MDQRQELGKEGEALACNYLIRNGYSIRHTNWHFGHKELDIVAQKDDMLVVCEVKTRFGDHWEDPKDAVTRRKQRNIVEAADAYVREFDLNLEVQFDIISIIFRGESHELEHIPDAFFPTL